MIRTLLMILAAATPAAAQVAPLSFEAGKSLQITPGQWDHVATATWSEARYSSVLSIRCDRQTRTVTISSPAQSAATLTVATSELTRQLPVGGRLAANDPLLDAIAFSRGRFLVSAGTGSVLAIPSWPEAARAIEDCRN
jgi:hypothetical protein